jgi:hypothetical protein
VQCAVYREDHLNSTVRLTSVFSLIFRPSHYYLDSVLDSDRDVCFACSIVHYMQRDISRIAIAIFCVSVQP